MPAGEDAESMRRHEQRLLEMAQDQQRSNPLTVTHLMKLTFGVRRRMLFGQMGANSQMHYHSVADVINRFPFIIKDEYVNY